MGMTGQLETGLNIDGGTDGTTIGNVADSLKTSLTGLNVIKTTQYTVGTSAVQLAPSPLASRSSISIKLVGPNKNDTLYLGPTNAVTSSNGYILLYGESIQLDLTATGTIWAIGSAAGQKVYVMEIGS